MTDPVRQIFLSPVTRVIALGALAAVPVVASAGPLPFDELHPDVPPGHTIRHRLTGSHRFPLREVTLKGPSRPVVAPQSPAGTPDLLDPADITGDREYLPLTAVQPSTGDSGGIRLSRIDNVGGPVYVVEIPTSLFFDSATGHSPLHFPYLRISMFGGVDTAGNAMYLELVIEPRILAMLMTETRDGAGTGTINFVFSNANGELALNDAAPLGDATNPPMNLHRFHQMQDPMAVGTPPGLLVDLGVDANAVLVQRADGTIVAVSDPPHRYQMQFPPQTWLAVPPRPSPADRQERGPIT